MPDSPPTLLDVAARVARADDRDALLTTLCAGVAEVLGCERVAVLVAGERNLTPEVAVGWDIDDPETHLALLAAGGGVPLIGRDGTQLGTLHVDGPDVPELRPLADVAAATLETLRTLADERRRVARDPLTGLPSGHTLTERLEHALRRARREPDTVALMVVEIAADLDDEAMRLLAARIDTSLRPADTVARMDDGRFVALCEDIGGRVAAFEVAARLREALAEPINGIELAATVAVSMPAYA